MKINEFAIVEPKVDEAPQGILKRTGLGIAKAFGSDKAAGKLETGKLANTIKKAFNFYLGKTGDEASAETLIAFLKLNKYPTQNVEKMAQQMAADAEAKANKNKMQPGPVGDQPSDGGDDNVIQMPSQSDIKQFGQGESIAEAELKGKQIDQLIMQAAKDAGRMQAGMSTAGGAVGGGKTGGGIGTGGASNQDMKKALQRLKSETGITNVNMAAQAINKLSTGDQVTKQEREAIAPLLSGLVNSFQDPQGINRMLQMMKQANKS